MRLGRTKLVELFLVYVIRVACISVFLIQINSLTTRYRYYDILEHEIKVSPEMVEIPEVHLMIPYQYTIDINILRTKFRAQFKRACEIISKGKKSDPDTCDEHLVNPIYFTHLFGPSLSLGEIAKYTYPSNVLVPAAVWPDSNEDLLKSGRCKAIRKAQSMYFRVIISCLDSHGKPIKVSRSGSILFNYYSVFSLVINATAALMRIEYPGQTDIEDQSNYHFSSITPGRYSANWVRFIRHEKHLLPAPYKSDCKNYDRYEIFEDCLNNASVQLYDRLYPLTSITLPNHKYYRADRYFCPRETTKTSNQSRNLIEIYNECKKLIQQPTCDSVKYTFRTESTSQYTEPGAEIIEVLFIISSEPDIYIETKPEFPIFEYLILAASLFSSWFGISIMGQLITATRLIKFCHNHKNGGKRVKSFDKKAAIADKLFHIRY